MCSIGVCHSSEVTGVLAITVCESVGFVVGNILVPKWFSVV